MVRTAWVWAGRDGLGVKGMGDGGTVLARSEEGLKAGKGTSPRSCT